MLDFTLLQTWHLFLLLVVFSSVFFLIERKIKHIKREKRDSVTTTNTPYAGFILLAVITVGTLPLINDNLLRIGFMLAAVLVVFIGRTDEITPLKPTTQLIWQIIIVSLLVSFGWTIPYVSNPWGEGVISLEWFRIGWWMIPGGVLAAIWLLFFINAINWMDGVDGLAGSVLTVAFGALAAISLLPSTQDLQTLLLAIIGVASMLAFLLWNFPPAKVQLGTVGSWFIGLYVALTAMNGGGKLVTTILILALPVLDVFFVIFRRLWLGQPIWQGDTDSHLHHRLLSGGVTPRNITLAASVITAGLALAGLLVSTSAKLGILLVLAVGFLLSFIRVLSKQSIIIRS